MARSVVEGMASIGMASGTALLGAGSAVTAVMTNLMADGPAAASVGPITLNMAAVANPGTTLVPFMGLATAAASSFAYLLVIGTPPNAIVYSCGYLTAKDFLRVGIKYVLFLRSHYCCCLVCSTGHCLALVVCRLRDKGCRKRT